MEAVATRLKIFSIGPLSKILAVNFSDDMVHSFPFCLVCDRNQVYCAFHSAQNSLNWISKLENRRQELTVQIYMCLSWIGSLRANQEWHNTTIEPIHIYKQLYLFSKLHKWQAATNKEIFLVIWAEEKVICSTIIVFLVAI